MVRLIFITVFLGFFALNTVQEKGFKARGLETAGEQPVSKWLFVLGKLSTLLCWAAAFVQALGLNLRIIVVPPGFEAAAAGLFAGGFAVLWLAYRDLGDANTTGLPKAGTQLRTGGVYAYSRNPLYLGLYLMTAGAVTYCGCAVVLALGVAAVAAHHRIVLAEETFLQARFGQAYAEYKARTRRYI
ncbi:MAG: methyltransferase [Elusimicrobiales bacterium]|nr:methyltransferase [Elusimicrobiales bacterium]